MIVRPIARRRLILGCAAVLGLAAVGWPRPARACSCMRMPPGEAFKRAGAVFAGTVVETHAVASPQFDDLAETRVTVEQVLRGDPGTEVVISHGTDLNACGVALDAGERLLFFTEPVVDGRTRTSYCSMLYADQYQQGGR